MFLRGDATVKMLQATLMTLLVGAATTVRAEEATPVKIRIEDDHIDFLAGDDLVTRYNKGPNVAKPYFWPLLGPGGVALTRGWPMQKGLPNETADHPHQKSAWFCHGDIIPEGLELKHRLKNVDGVDFWSELPGHGREVCVKVSATKVAGNHGQVSTHNEWRTADGTKVLEEQRTLHFYNFGRTRLIVIESDLEASAFPLTFGDTKEGSMGIRINDTMREAKGGNGHLENAEGKKGEKECWGQFSAWCDYAGELDGKKVGLALLADPTNPYPTCWHSRGYGLMAANPFGRTKSGFPAQKGKTDLVKLGKGEHLKFRYGLLLHPGDAREGKVAEFFEKFVKAKG
jgi:hypothetical protein